MVQINEGDEPQKVPLVYYDEEGERHVVGEAAVQIVEGEVLALGHLTSSASGLGPLSIGSMNLETLSFSESTGHQPSLVERASARLGVLNKGSRAHVTESNPNGETRQCERRDLHEPHEYQAEFGAYFNVYCPGNTGSER